MLKYSRTNFRVSIEFGRAFMSNIYIYVYMYIITRLKILVYHSTIRNNTEIIALRLKLLLMEILRIIVETYHSNFHPRDSFFECIHTFLSFHTSVQ